MTIFSLRDCCHLLAIDPKTLHRWLGLSQMSVQPHPLDARMKCLTREQLQQLAAAHRRLLPDLEGERGHQPEAFILPPPTSVMSTFASPSVLSDVSSPPTEFRKQLADLRAHVAVLQQHITLLSEHLQKASELRATGGHVPQDASLPLPVEEPAQALTPAASPASLTRAAALPHPEPDPQPGDRRRQHAHVLPVVEYGVHGQYVVICPELGKLSLQPDSPEWFAWLDTLPSFRFVGQLGRLTAHRGYQCPPGTPWRAHRQIRNHTYNHRLGKTECLTIAALEQAAAALQLHMH